MTTTTSTSPTTTPSKDCKFQDDFKDACAVVECDRRTEKYIFKGIDRKCPYCKTYLDPHIVTYDQRWRSYSYQGCGNYSLSQFGNSYNPDMAVYSSFKTCGGKPWVTCLDTVTFKVDNHTVITLSYEKKIEIQVNGGNMDKEPSYAPSVVQAMGQDYPVLIWKYGSCVNLQGSAGIMITFCGYSRANLVYVYASQNVSADLEGLCGSINSDIDDDFVTRDGAVVSPWKRYPPKEFPLSWLTNAASNGSCGGGTEKPLNRCEKNVTVEIDIRNRCQNTVTNERPNAQPGEVEALVDDCVYDMCNVTDPDQWLIEFAENLQDEDERSNNTIVCKFEDEFKDTCAVVECDSRSERYIFKGYDRKCPVCKTYLDPHIVTYDQRWRSYSYQGCGNYSLSQFGNSYNPDMAVYSTFKTCGGKPWVTCLDTVTFKIDNHTVITLSYDKEIEIQVNGANMDKEPSYVPSIVQAMGQDYPVLIWKYSSCVNLQGSAGIMIKFCGYSRANLVYVYASQNVSADLEGLCGSINSDIDDDFVTRDGAVVSPWKRNPPKEFPLSWLTNAASNGSCGGETERPLNRCEKNATVEKNIRIRCQNTITPGLPNAQPGLVEALVDDCVYDMCNVTNPDEWLQSIQENLKVENETSNNTIERPISPTLPQECPKDPGYFVHSNQCFKFLHEGGWINWTYANARCGLLGLVLAKPHDIVGLEKVISETFGNKGAWQVVHRIWLGGRGNGSEVIWDRDGSILPRNDSAWLPGHPTGKTSSDRCLAFGSNLDDGQYYMALCNWNGQHPLCEYTTTPPKKGNLTWHNVGSDRFARIPEYHNWFDSRRICQINGLDLYHPKNSTAVAIYLDDNFFLRRYWLGARGNGTNQVWVDGDILTYADPWDFPYYHYNNGTNDCLLLNTCCTFTETGKVLTAKVNSCYSETAATLCG